MPNMLDNLPIIPNYICAELAGGPAFENEIFSLNNGFEFINPVHINCQNQYFAENVNLSFERAQQVSCIFRNAKGKLGFLKLNDMTDNIISEQVLGMGNGNQTDFPIFKQYMNNHTLQIPKPDILGSHVESISKFDSDRKQDIEQVETSIKPPQSESLVSLESEIYNNNFQDQRPLSQYDQSISQNLVVSQKRIYSPISDSVNISDEEQDVPKDLYLVRDGIVIFKTPPKKNKKIYISCQHHTIVRFNQNNISLKPQPDGSILIEKIQFKEVFLGD